MSDELTLRLRELAESAESLPPGSGAEVRATAGRRRRRRRTTAAVAGGCAAAGLAAVLTLNTVSHGTERDSALAASAPPSATAAPPDATVDLSRRVLTVAGRELPISAGTVETPTPTGLMTVTAKADVKLVPGATVGFGDEYDGQLTWVLELTPVGTDATDATGGSAWAEATAGTAGTAGTGTNAGADAFDPADPSAETDRTEPTDGPTDGTDGTGPGERFSAVPTRPPGDSEVWIAALPLYEKAPGTSDLTSDLTSGWIGLRTTDARWLYGRLTTGAIVEIRGTSPTPPTAVPTHAPSQTPPG
ncbi:murein L,D-transpeptidase [Streptomyces caniscabiei]|uniref:Murein L,D-transpeptidase n=1 Tax=Streptomyces caniscabiei TaxID=2746961 RepID=A0A927L8L0_9ACTN|nr:L,D-transpeptidase family protein [Streptomyces caniscabiei]MBD9724523.1 murein L,D-transpeptidase [Streptomyces caniscabiei]MDX3507935.1 murein L,D-transpeptidase [Streptomyces caniscabiei]MDX3717897.1 murein L,D-transpeptidase [Streptomyces caniscabiei]WEO25626.1 murein L,D-transpeptidase [Streptomyces caniscabiei]